MKLIVSWVPERTGSALAYLVGMLTLGTALPQGLRFLGGSWRWQAVILSSSGLGLLAAALIFFLGDGPHFTVRSASGGRRMGGVLPAFASPHLRAAALGYFGHMRELYSFWTLAPQILSAALKARQPAVPGLAFAITAIGAIGCIAGGGVEPQSGQRAPCRSVTGCFRVLLPDCRRRLEATFTLWLSGTAPGVGSRGGCRLSPVFRLVGPAAAPANLVGGVMAIQNSVGFAITIVSIALATSLYPQFGIECRLGLVAGPDTRTYRLLPPVGDTYRNRR